MKKIGLVIQARMNSSRLRGKTLKLLDDKTLIEWIIKRVKKTKIKNIFLATGSYKVNLELKRICIKENIIFISDHYIANEKKIKFQNQFKQKIYFFDNRYFYFYLTLNFIFNPYLFLCCLKILLIQNKKFSIGFLSILMLINLDIKPNVFGLDISENMSKRRHYYKNTKVGSNHNLKLEHKLLFELSRLKKINIK